MTQANTVVWTEIPATDLNAARAFYSAVLGRELKMDESGPNPMVPLGDGMNDAGAAGHIYPGKPAPEGTGNTIHLTAPGTLEEVMDRVRDAGGRVTSDPIPIPAGRFFYALDLDGNSIGLFEG
ncbi:VOC family protein [Jannaschia sp. S6380]|uniref:VOC family protein n=1 Tax=Jannaschia sp. S6380 TaxID=2926408 RepID=UPI001FF175BB|nr:VOC family protein [Jannaschia sp. S6380]MCK0166846.1 VOC family protein [Jannaschia sp. S6380]